MLTAINNAMVINKNLCEFTISSHVIAESFIKFAKKIPFSQLHGAGFQT